MDSAGTMKSLYSEDVLLEVKDHASSCKEFVVRSPRFKFKSWLLWTTFFNVLGYMLQLHTRDPRMMLTVAVLLFIILIFKLHLKVTQETLLVMASIGVQITTKFATGRTQSRFYDRKYVKDIIINEAITMQRVIYYLALLLREDSRSGSISKLIPLFKHSWPSLPCLKLIYQGAQECLFVEHVPQRKQANLSPNKLQESQMGSDKANQTCSVRKR